MYVASDCTPTKPGLHPLHPSVHCTDPHVSTHSQSATWVIADERVATRQGTRSCDRGGRSDIMGLEERACRHRADWGP